MVRPTFDFGWIKAILLMGSLTIAGGSSGYSCFHRLPLDLFDDAFDAVLSFF